MARDSLQLKDLHGRDDASMQLVDVDAEHDPDVSRRASNAALAREAVQMRAGGGATAGNVHAAAEQGVQTPAQQLPHFERIQQAFGNHDVSGIQAHVDGGATDAMGAEAYATGNHVVFGQQPDLHTAAHEAAHVVQQRAGVHLKGGVGAAGDSYEQNADAVADRVVQGKSAEDLLGPASETTSAAPEGAIQRKDKKVDPKEADNRSDYDSRDAVIASMQLLAKHLHEGGKEMIALVKGDHSGPAGTEPAVQRLGELFDQILSESSHVSAIVSAFKLDDTYRSTLVPAAKQIVGAYSRFAAPMPMVNSFTKANHDPKERNPYWVKQNLDSIVSKVAPGIELEGDTTAPTGTAASLHDAAIGAHIEGATSAAKSVQAGNAQDAPRVKQHVAELTWLARGHKNEMKKHKKDLAELKTVLKALVKEHPELDELVKNALKELGNL